ncbi:MAG TPA: hypothetical protein VK841_02740 [Polyangiaceae bacterium]|jgi:hypothetical protein|nr:hypothetical protein [Polyangiaceae bacterium]
MKALVRLRLSKNVPFAVALVAALSWSAISHAADGDDEKRACVDAADRGQLVRDAGKYSEATAQFTRCAAEECPTIVRAQCGLWLGQVLEAMPTVVFAMADSSGHDLTDVRVFESGKMLVNGLDGRPIRLDPGAHELRFESLGHDPVVTTVVLGAGDKNRAVKAIAFDSAPFVGPVAPPPLRTALDARTVTSLGLVTAGALAAGAGLYFALSSQNEADDAASLRQSVGTSGCRPPGIASTAVCGALSSDVNTQGRDAAWGTGLYIAGGLLAAVGAITWIAWPKHANAKRSDRMSGLSVSPLLGAGRVGLRAEIELQ